MDYRIILSIIAESYIGSAGLLRALCGRRREGELRTQLGICRPTAENCFSVVLQDLVLKRRENLLRPGKMQHESFDGKGEYCHHEKTYLSSHRNSKRG